MRFLAAYGLVFCFLATVSSYAQTGNGDLDGYIMETEDNLEDREIVEWKKLKYFEAQLNASTSTKTKQESEFRDYARDSIKILRVKLLAIKILNNKELLELDIAENPEYYLGLLIKLKKSGINRSEYLFLENKLAFLTTEVAESKYETSKFIMGLLALCIVGLVVLVFWIRHKGNNLPVMDLSKQERNVQGLILQGKSNKEIANELFISLSTVKTHITNIYSKLRVSSREELVQKLQN